MATGIVEHLPADLRRPRGREAFLNHPPPAPVADSTSGSLERPDENTSARATPLSPEAAYLRKTATWAWSNAETECGRHGAATQPTLAPIDAFPDESAAADLAAVGLDATGPYSRTIRGLLGGACAGWRVRPTSVALYYALRAANPTSRQRSIVTVLNEAFFEELVDAHSEGAFTCRQLARAARRRGAVPPLRIRLINAFATPPPRPENPWRTLTVPEPAASLWAAKASDAAGAGALVSAPSFTRCPPDMFRRRILPHISSRVAVGR